MASKAKFFVGGNWKCNGTITSVSTLVSDLNAGSVPRDVDIVVAPPFLHLDHVNSRIDKDRYQVSAQNCWPMTYGAYTGEVNVDMLKDFGIPWVITGHSERRSLFAESSDLVGRKTAAAVDAGLKVIACIGETLEQRQSGNMFKVLDDQMAALLKYVPKKEWSNVVLAYEPVWAIGTGVVASPEQAQEVHNYLRMWIKGRLGPDVSDELRIIYGGSVNEKNCEELSKKEDIDGFLVGGASLKASSFLAICNAANAKLAAA